MSWASRRKLNRMRGATARKGFSPKREGAPLPGVKCLAEALAVSLRPNEVGAHKPEIWENLTPFASHPAGAVCVGLGSSCKRGPQVGPAAAKGRLLARHAVPEEAVGCQGHAHHHCLRGRSGVTTLLAALTSPNFSYPTPPQPPRSACTKDGNLESECPSTFCIAWGPSASYGGCWREGGGASFSALPGPF